MFWVSRRAFDEVKGERDHQRQVNRDLLAAIIRISRKSQGMPETPRDERKAEAKEKIPPQIRELIGQWENESTRRRMLQQVAIMRKGGMPWEAIAEKIQAS